MAVTATATLSTVKDIKESLHLRADCEIIQQSFCRPNLNLLVKPKPPGNQADLLDSEIIKFIQLRYLREAGIIYCLAKEKCEKIAKTLNANGLNAEHYHAGL